MKTIGIKVNYSTLGQSIIDAIAKQNRLNVIKFNQKQAEDYYNYCLTAFKDQPLVINYAKKNLEQFKPNS